MKKSILVLIILATCHNGFSQNVGIGTATPSDKLHINSPSGFDPPRVDINNTTKLRVWANGGTTIGASTNPPADGLLVQGTIQPQNNISTPNKMYVESIADSLVIRAGGSKVIIAANGNITIQTGGTSMLKVESGGDLTVQAGGNLTLKGTTVNLQSSAALTVSGATITQNASGNMIINGSILRLNNGVTPIARLGDSVTGSVISAGSTTVFSN